MFIGYSNFFTRHKKILLTSTLLCIVFLSIFAYLISLQGFSDPDAWYHLAVTQELRDHGIIHEFRWLPLTSLYEVYVDHHFGYHILLIPFITLLDPFIGILLATAVIITAFGYMVWHLLSTYELPHRWIAFLILFTSSGFLFRFSLVKSIALFWIFLIATFLVLEKRNYLLLALLSALGVFIHGGFILIPLTVLLYECVKAYTDPLLSFWDSCTSKSTRTAVLASLGGMFAGILISPYRFEYVAFLKIQLFAVAVSVNSHVYLANEWLGGNFNFVMTYAPLGALVFAIITTAYLVHPPLRTSRQTLFWYLYSFIWLILTIKSRRYIEMFVPAISITSVFAYAHVHHACVAYTKTLPSYVKIFFITPLALVVLHTLTLTYAYTYQGVRPFDRSKALVSYVTQQTNQSNIVNIDFGDFPSLMYWGRDLTYIQGLDPLFLADSQPEVYQELKALMEGETIDLSFLEKYRFSAHLLLIPKTPLFNNLRELATTTQDATILYEDADYLLLHVL